MHDSQNKRQQGDKGGFWNKQKKYPKTRDPKKIECN